MTEEIEQHILRRYEVVKKVGSGAYGHVWKVSDRKTGQIMALKKIFDAFQHTTDAQRTYRQIMFLRQFAHENIIRLLHVYRAENDKDIYLVFEFMEADLHNVIRYVWLLFSENILQDIHKQYIIYQIALALRYLHSGEVIHRDMKPSNVLLNSECFVRICDFGLVRSIAKHDEHSPVLTQYVATRWYRAPEILLGANEYGKSVDMWSLGCIFAEIMIGKPIFPGSSTLHQLEKILSFTNKPSPEDIDALKSDLARSMIDTVSNIKYRTPKEWFPGCSDEMIDLVVCLLQFNPNKRLTADELLKHPYLKQFMGKGSEILAGKVFRIYSDDQKLTTKDYRNLIYESLKEERDAARGTLTKELPTTSKYQYRDLATGSRQGPITPTTPNSPKNTFTSTTAANFTSQQRKQKVDELIKESSKQQPFVRKKNSSSNLKEEPERERVKYPQTSKMLSSIPTSNYASEISMGTYLSPKARLNPTSPTLGIKPNSPIYKYAYGTKDGQQSPQPPQHQPFFRKK